MVYKGFKVFSISIHALREEGDLKISDAQLSELISIHALREEGDREDSECAALMGVISIHALREEGDLMLLKCTIITTTNFNPRPP